MKKICYLFLCLICAMSLRAASTDSVRVSLLTCAPGSAIYALFGHSALRYENPSLGQDWVFNYGMFSFRDPNFVMRFVKGETDYQLGVVNYRYFESEYALRGSSVTQQVLNLTAQEKNRLLQLLQQNYLPENRTYRYNYFYDNCTTRARDKVEECIEGEVVYREDDRIVTFRGIIHEFTAGSEWSEFGIDLCLGSEADQPIDLRKQMFAPFYMLAAAREANIYRGDSVVPFVLEEFKAVDVAPEEHEAGFPLSPMTCACLLLVMTVVLMACSIKQGKVYWLFDLLLFGAQGLGGCIIAFLFFFSVHPTVGSNWLIVLFNPIPLIYLPVMVYKGVKGRKDVYHWANLTVLTLFICIMPFLDQKFNLSVLPLASVLMVTSLAHIIVYKRKHS